MPPSGKEDISLYIHVPFCIKKCGYCHFYVVPNQPRFHTLYMRALKHEWNLRKHHLKDKQLVSLYFGGGTPALLGPDHIAEILSWIDPPDACEITLEANPENLAHFPGINRLSLGVQSLDTQDLVSLTRSHSPQTAISTIENSSVKNISIDLMYDTPNQTLPSWQKTLTQATKLPITHLSLYNLTIEPHTSFYKNRQTLKTPDTDTSLNMLETAVNTLTQAGFERYEISAFAKPGYESRHNTGYWTSRPFLGLGPSACSYINGTRSRNIPNLNKYAKHLESGEDPTDFSETLDPLHALKESLAIRLRLLKPLDSWPAPLEDKRLELEEAGLLNGLQLSDKGILFHDTVAEILM